MPELPEVEACRRLAERHCRGKRILQAQVADDDKVIEGIEPAKLQTALQGQTVKVAQRKGKHMWLDFDAGPSLMLHFGMTGSLVVKGVKSHQYRSFKVDSSDWPPKFWKVLLDLEGDVSIAFSDSRRFARVRLQEDPASHEPVSLLGFDPVLSMPSLPEFTELIKAQKRSLKALLLDQAFSAGVGNWVADEVLYQAKLYPEVKANSLTDDEIQRLHEAIKQVPAAAVEAEADSEKFPPDWLFHVRWDGKKKNPKINGNAVEFLKVGGRTTAYVPAVQKAAAGGPPNKAKGKTTAKGKRKADSDAESDEEEDSEEEYEGQEQGPFKNAGKEKEKPQAKKKKKLSASGGDKGKAAKGRAKAGKAVAMKQPEGEEEQSASDAEEEEEEQAKPVKQKVAAGAAKKKKSEMQSGKEEGKGSKAGPAQAKAARGKPKAAQAKKKMKEMSDEEKGEDEDGQEPAAASPVKKRQMGSSTQAAAPGGKRKGRQPVNEATEED